MSLYENGITRGLRDIFGEHRPVWIWGVCAAIAARLNWETWAVRVAAAVSLVFLTPITLIVYVALGLLLPECRDGAVHSIRQLVRLVEQLVQLVTLKISQWLGNRRPA